MDYAATSPNLLAAYVRIVKGEKIETQARATSQVRCRRRLPRVIRP